LTADMVERVTQVVVSPTRLEYERHRDLYPALVAELEKRGFEATLDEPPTQRGGFEFASAEVVVYVGEGLGAVALGVLANAIWDGLKAAAKRRGGHSTLDPEDSGQRRAAILGPDGEVLKEVVLDDNEPS
jgi:hypothetical protein